MTNHPGRISKVWVSETEQRAIHRTHRLYISFILVHAWHGGIHCLETSLYNTQASHLTWLSQLLFCSFQHVSNPSLTQ